MNKEIFIKNIEFVTDYNVLPENRYFKITSNKDVVHLFTNEIDKTSNFINKEWLKENGIDLTNLLSFKIAMIFLPGYGWIEFHICKESKFSIEVI